MAKISSKQVKRQIFINPIQGPVVIMLIGILIFLSLFSASTYHAISTALETLNNARNTASESGPVSLASDLQYWSTNCSHGWSSDAKCDGIVSRVQLCSESIASKYCSDYAVYMQQFLDQP